MDTKGGKPWGAGDGGVLNWAIGIGMYTLICIKLMTNKILHAAWRSQKKKKRLSSPKKACGYGSGDGQMTRGGLLIQHWVTR